jgi:azurin
MKIFIRKMVVLLAIVISLAAVQAVWANTCNVTVSGTVDAIDSNSNAITVDGTIVNGIPLTYLANKLNIVIGVDDYVVITAEHCPSTGILRACTLSVNDSNAINLPGNRSR